MAKVRPDPNYRNTRDALFYLEKSAPQTAQGGESAESSFDNVKGEERGKRGERGGKEEGAGT